MFFSGKMGRMGLLCDYFVASSDDDAAATIDWGGGPGRPAPAPSPPRRGLFRRHAEPATTQAEPTVLYPTVDGGGIEPLVQMGTLEALLTGRDYDDVMETTAKYQMPSGETHSPHRYVDPKAPVDPAAKPHNGKGMENTPECANCHTTPHPIPPDSIDEKEKAERLAKLEVELEPARAGRLLAERSPGCYGPG